MVSKHGSLYLLSLFTAKILQVWLTTVTDKSSVISSSFNCVWLCVTMSINESPLGMYCMDIVLGGGGGVNLNYHPRRGGNLKNF